MSFRFNARLIPVFLVLLSSFLAFSSTVLEPEESLPVLDDGHLSTASLPPDLIDSNGCSCPHSETRTTQEETTGARIFYLLVLHNQRTLDDALYLFRAIRDPRNIILIHIDVKLQKLLDIQQRNSSVAAPLLFQEVQACPCGSVVRIESLFNVSWSSWSMNLPTLWGIETAVTEYAGHWDVFINLSGDTLPVYSVKTMAQLLAKPLQGINFVTSHACETGLHPTPITDFPKQWHKRKHYQDSLTTPLDYTDAKGDSHNTTLTIQFGSQWMTLQPDFCRYIVQELQRPDSLANRFRDYLQTTNKLMADETFLPTLLVHEFPETLPPLNDDGALETLPSLYSIRYERMDEHVPSAFGYFPVDQRYEVPFDFGETQRPWGPYYLGVYDLRNLRDSGALFVRKVSRAVDPNLYHILPVDESRQIPAIQWPNEVRVTEKPDWEKLKAKILAARTEKQRLQAETIKTGKDGAQANELRRS